MLYLMAVLAGLVHITFSGGRVALSLFALDLGASALTVGLVMSMLSVIPMFFAVSWGRLIDRVGVKGPMYAGTAALLAGVLAAFALPRLETLFIASALIGSGFYLFHIAVNQSAGLIGKPEERVRNFSMIALAFSVSSVLGPVIAGVAIDTIGYRLTFLVLAAPAIAILIVMFVRPLEVPRAPPVPKGAGRRRTMDLLRMPEVRRTLIVSGMLSMAWDLFNFVMPIYGSRLRLSASTVGMILGVFGGAVFVVRLALPFFFRRVDEWKLLIGAMFISGAVLATIPLVSDVRLLVAIAFILGMGLGGAQPMIMSLLYTKSPPGRAAEAVGVRTLLINSSQFSIPLMFGALGAAVGMAPVFWSMALALIGGAWYARRGPDARPRA